MQAHFFFLGVYIDIDQSGIDGEVEQEDGVTIGIEARRIGVSDRIPDRRITDGASVNDEVLA